MSQLQSAAEFPLAWGKVQSKETNQEVPAGIQQRVDGGFPKGGGREGSKKWLDLQYIFQDMT